MPPRLYSKPEIAKGIGKDTAGAALTILRELTFSHNNSLWMALVGAQETGDIFWKMLPICVQGNGESKTHLTSFLETEFQSFALSRIFLISD